MVITEEIARSIAAAFVNIHETLYKADIECHAFSIGDVVLDRQDGTHGIVDGYCDGKYVLRDGYVVEVGVPGERLIKLNKIQ